MFWSRDRRKYILGLFSLFLGQAMIIDESDFILHLNYEKIYLLCMYVGVCVYIYVCVQTLKMLTTMKL